jgi:hypothetical protein
MRRAMPKIGDKTFAVCRLTKRYVIPPIKVGHHVRYREADLDAWAGVAANLK